jgi:hypothetical protein
MTEALSVVPQESFTKPTPIPSDIKPILRGSWLGESTINIHTILYWVNKNNPLGAYPSHPENDPQFILWETPIQKWAQQHNYKNGSTIQTGTITLPLSTTNSTTTITQ